jgi:agmatine deiminase
MSHDKRRRFPAEWEPQSFVQFTFPHADSDWASVLELVTPTFVNAITAVARFEPVLVVCDAVERVAPLLQHIPADRLRLVALPSNDTWARDHGGISIYENGEPVVLDFVFNGWGLKFGADRDNLLTRRLVEAGAIQAPRRQMDLVLEGGALETDGEGTLLTTAECLLSPNRNPWMSKDAIEAALKDRLGLNRVLWLNHGYLAGDDTDSHIDTLARFCDPQTIAYVQCLDEQDEHYVALQAMEKELQEFRQANGEPYQLVPLPMCSPVLDEEGNRLPATYANFLIVNGAVLVPVYDAPEDEQALAVLKTCFPQHEIVSVPCRPLVLQHGSLHCITMQYPAGIRI